MATTNKPAADLAYLCRALKAPSLATATVEGRAVRLQAFITGLACAELEEPMLVARRAGMTRSAPLAATQSCTYEGRFTVSGSGRWFIYATFDSPAGPRESWLPVEVADGTRALQVRDLYEPPARPGRTGDSQPVVGGMLLGFAAVLAGGTIRMASTTDRRTA